MPLASLFARSGGAADAISDKIPDFRHGQQVSSCLFHCRRARGFSTLDGELSVVFQALGACHWFLLACWSLCCLSSQSDCSASTNQSPATSSKAPLIFTSVACAARCRAPHPRRR